MVNVMYNEYIKNVFENLNTLKQVSGMRSSILSVELSLPRQCGKTTAIAKIACDGNNVIIIARNHPCTLDIKRLVDEIEANAEATARKSLTSIFKHKVKVQEKFDKNSIYSVNSISNMGRSYTDISGINLTIILDELTVDSFISMMSKHSINTHMLNLIRMGEIPILSINSK